MDLSVQEREAFQKVVQTFREKNPGLVKSKIVKHFVQLEYSSSTMYCVLNKLGLENTTKEKKRTGRPSTWTPKRKYRLKRLTNNRSDVSQHKLAEKFDLDHSTICRQLRRMKINFREREKTPKYSDKQAKKSRIMSRHLYKKLNSKKQVIVMDDEKYFSFATCHNKDYYTDNKNSC